MTIKNSDPTIEKRVLQSFKRVLGNKSVRISPASMLREDLGLDSFAIMELVFELEDTLGIKVPEDELKGVKTVKDTLSLVSRLKKKCP